MLNHSRNFTLHFTTPLKKSLDIFTYLPDSSTKLVLTSQRMRKNEQYQSMLKSLCVSLKAIKLHLQKTQMSLLLQGELAGTVCNTM